MEGRAVKIQSQPKRNCPVCGDGSGLPFLKGSINYDRLNGFSYASRKEPEFMSFPLVLCRNCGLVYASSTPDARTLAYCYSEAQYDSGEEAHFAAETYCRLLRPWLSQLPAKHQAVDIGAGNGALLSLLLADGFETVIGVEPSRAAIAAAPPDIQIYIRPGLFSRGILDTEHPDLVCAFQTLEHVEDPLSFLRDIYSILSPGGLVALVVHDRQALFNRVLGSRSPIIDIEHLQLFNPQSLHRLLTESSFRTAAIRHFNNTYPLKYWIRLLPIPSRMKHGLLSVIGTVRLVELPLTIPVGNIFAIGLKPK